MSTPADALLSRLDGVRRTGPDRWVARCPAHDDKRASLGVRELDDGRVLLHCFSGCGVEDVVGAAGLALADLFPPSSARHAVKGERRPFPAADVLRAVAFEALVVSVAAVDLARGRKLSDEDRERLRLAAGRLQEAADAVR